MDVHRQPSPYHGPTILSAESLATETKKHNKSLHELYQHAGTTNIAHAMAFNDTLPPHERNASLTTTLSTVLQYLPPHIRADSYARTRILQDLNTRNYFVSWKEPLILRQNASWYADGLLGFFVPRNINNKPLALHFTLHNQTYTYMLTPGEPFYLKNRISFEDPYQSHTYFATGHGDYIQAILYCRGRGRLSPTAKL